MKITIIFTLPLSPKEKKKSPTSTAAVLLSPQLSNSSLFGLALSSLFPKKKKPTERKQRPALCSTLYQPSKQAVLCEWSSEARRGEVSQPAMTAAAKRTHTHTHTLASLTAQKRLSRSDGKRATSTTIAPPETRLVPIQVTQNADRRRRLFPAQRPVPENAAQIDPSAHTSAPEFQNSQAPKLFAAG